MITISQRVRDKTKASTSRATTRRSGGWGRGTDGMPRYDATELPIELTAWCAVKLARCHLYSGSESRRDRCERPRFLFFAVLKRLTAVYAPTHTQEGNMTQRHPRTPRASFTFSTTVAERLLRIMLSRVANPSLVVVTRERHKYRHHVVLQPVSLARSVPLFWGAFMSWHLVYVRT